MQDLTIIVPAVPVAQPRTRATSIHGRARAFVPTDHPVQAFKATVRMAARQAYVGPAVYDALRVDITFVMPRPAGLVWKKKPMPRLPHTRKPDRDNLDKSVLDALSGLLWVDDAQVCDGRIRKVVAAGDEQPHVEIVVSRVTNVE